MYKYSNRSINYIGVLWNTYQFMKDELVSQEYLVTNSREMINSTLLKSISLVEYYLDFKR
jgi:hypothetical protein